MLSDYPDILTINDICKILNFSQKTVYKLVHSKEINAKKICRQFRIQKTELLRYLNEN